MTRPKAPNGSMRPRGPMGRRSFIGAWGLLALLLLASFPLAEAQAPPVVEASVATRGTALEVTLRSDSRDNVTLVVTHEDPLLGTVADKVVEASVSATAQSVVLEDLRLDTSFTVRVLDSALTLPGLPNVTRLVDGARIPELPTLAILHATPILPGAADATRTVHSYPIADASWDFRGILATRTGAVVAISLQRAYETPAYYAWTSLDGGHTFGSPVLLTERGASADYAGWSEVGEGRVAFLARADEDETGQDGRLKVMPWNVTLFDPQRGQVVDRIQIGADGRARLGMANYEFAFQPDGSVLVAFQGSSEETLPNGTVVRRSYGDGIQFWRLAVEGHLTHLTTIPVPSLGHCGYRVTASPTGALGAAILFTDSGNCEAGTISYATAPDGRTFGAWRTASAPQPPDWRTIVHDLDLDAAGTLHVTLEAALIREVEGVDRNGTATRSLGVVAQNAYVVRLPAVGPASVTDLGAATSRPSPRGDVSPTQANLVVDGLRSWAVWANGGDLWAMESVDGGITRAAAVRLSDAEAPDAPHSLGIETQVAILPDGRPILLAYRAYRHVAIPLYEPVLDDALLARIVPKGAPPRLLLELMDTGTPVLLPGGRATLHARVRAPGAGSLRASVWVNDTTGLVLAPPAQVTLVNGTGYAEVELRASTRLSPGRAMATEVALSLHAEALGLPASEPVPARVRAIPEPFILVPPEDSLDLDAGGASLVAVRVRNVAPWALNASLEVLAAPGFVAAKPRAEPLLVAPGKSALAWVDVSAMPHATATRGAVVVVANLGFVPGSAEASFVVAIAPAPAAEAPGGSAEPLETPPHAPGDEASGAVVQAGQEAPRATVPAPVAGGAAVVGTVVLAAAATESGRWLAALGAATLYSRLKRANVLDHARRQAVYDAVRNRPGARFEELRRGLDLSYGALAYHLRVLEREGYLTARTDWSRRRFYPSGLAPPSAQAREVADRIVALVTQQPGLGQSDVARALGMSRQLAAYHLGVVAAGGRVMVAREGRRVRYYALTDSPRGSSSHGFPPRPP